MNTELTHDEMVRVGQALSDDQRWTMTAYLVGLHPEAFCEAVAYAMKCDAAVARYHAREAAARNLARS